ncbi:hypothetical protein M5K25_025161 [Dendrobium thyrsiflorum]|uniref:DUF4283 domain-containing protein n=1 Tax=Dendrobium thyrsiflorum TaxID=117978 RepID=A0ABD0U3I0_DENTH
MVGRLVDPGFLIGKASSRSFKDALANDSHSSNFPELKITSHRGMPSLWISEGEILAHAAPFEFALVGKFPARRPSLEAIHNFFFYLKLMGEVSVTILNMRHILIKLVNDLDYCMVFAYRSYFVNNCYMKLFKWSPMFDVEVESPIIPIWVSFPHLRPHLFTPRILNGLGSLFGLPLKIDHATVCGSRPSIARVLVELDVTKHYLDRVWVGPENLDYIQEVIMEEFPSYCSQYKSLGHSKLECCALNKTRSIDVLQSNAELVNYKVDLNPLKEVVENVLVVHSLEPFQNAGNIPPSVEVDHGVDEVSLGAGGDDNAGEQENSLNSDNVIHSNVALIESVDVNLFKDGVVEDGHLALIVTI